MSGSGDSEDVRRWVETWRRAGDALDAVKRAELASYDYEANRETIDAMLDWACEHSLPRLTSGFVEQQRVFLKLLGRRGERP